jgi:hypothetical protein
MRGGEEYMIEPNCSAFGLPRRLTVKIRELEIASLLIACVLSLVEGCMGSSNPDGFQAVAHTEGLSVAVRASDGTFQITTENRRHSVIRTRVAAEIDHKWIKSTDYPKHEISESSFEYALGHGKKITVTSIGLANFPDLAYTLQIYDGRAFGVIETVVQNHTARPSSVG